MPTDFQKKAIGISGWLIIDKPLGMTSAHVVARIKRLTRAKVGHAGTLDPLATGVLPIALNEATKTTQFLIDSDKAYDFEVTWGEERSTDDGEGEVVRISDLGFEISDLENILEKFRGEIQQVPPQYSAIKTDGKKAYDTARQGGITELKSRKVIIHKLQTINHKLQTTAFHLECSKGTYVRSLARDMGREIGCFGYVSRLRRTSHGCFSIKNAISLENLEEMCKTGRLAEVILPLHEVLDGIPALQLSEDQTRKIRFGIALDVQVQIGLIALFSGQTLVAIADSDGMKVQPKRVFN